MTKSLKRDWRKGAKPIKPGAVYRQIAALCWRKKGKAREVLLITSRDSGRWIIPKGWPIDGKSAAQAAAQEAWEEAGVIPAKIDKKSIGTFAYDKALTDGKHLPIEARVFAIEVERLSKQFPEKDERKRKWVRPDVAVGMVKEKKLKDILREF